jgi:hypothetical protein
MIVKVVWLYTIRPMIVVADPNIVSFYVSKGFHEIDRKDSTIPDHFLSVMQKDVRL